MIVPGASLIVSAAVCAALEQAVTDAEAAARRNGITPDAEVAATLVDLHELARWWRARVASAPLDDAAEARSPSAPMTVNEAAAALGVTPHRVRQRLRARTLPGERVHGRWHVHPITNGNCR